MLRCKFKLDGVTKPEDGSNRTVRLSASYGDGGDNKDWSKWTPSGDLSFCVTNENAFPKIDAMKPGELYYLDITPVTPAV